MATKKSSLSDFSEKRKRTAPAPVEVMPEPVKRELVTITTRMSPPNWKRLRELALHERTTLQNITMRGYNLVLAEKGLPPLTDN